MQWDDVRIFLAVTRECTFSAAAKRLGVQVSTVSRRINLLEERLGFDLVDRSVSGYTITQAGAKLRETALVVEKAFLEFAEKSDVPDCDVRGELRIAAIPDMASSVLMPAFARFKLAYPNIQLRIEVNNHNVRLAEREADIALRQTNRPTETLFGTQLTTVASAVYGSVQYANKVSGDLNKATWIGVNCCEYHKAWTHKHCTENAQTFWVDDTSLTAAALHEGARCGLFTLLSRRF